MAVNLSTASTGVFARLGKLFGVLDRTITFQDDIIDASSKKQSTSTSLLSALQVAALSTRTFGLSAISRRVWTVLETKSMPSSSESCTLSLKELWLR